MRHDKRYVVAAAVAAAAAVFIAVSACFLFVPAGEGGFEGLFATTVEAASGEGAPSGDARTAEVAAGGSLSGAAGETAGSPGAAASDVSQGGADGVGGSGGSGEAPGSSQGGSDSASSGGAASGASSSSPASSEGDKASAEESQTVTVSVTVSSSAVGGGVSGSARPTLAQGATAYDALCAVGLSVNAERTSYGIYVTSVGGLAQKEHGGKSGWMYSVNGAVPMTSCGNYVLHDGDDVQWYYVV